MRSRPRVARIQNLKADPGASSAINLTRSVPKNPAVARALGVSSDLHELREPVSRNDPQLPSYAVVRMQQCVDGVKVLGAELVMSVRLTPSPAIDTLTSSLSPDLPQSMVPKSTPRKQQKPRRRRREMEQSRTHSACMHPSPRFLDCA